MLMKAIIAIMTFVTALSGHGGGVYYADSHNDTLTAAFDSGQGLFENALHVDIARLSEYNAPVIVFAVWVDPNIKRQAFDYTNEVIDYFLSELEKNSAYISLALTKEDLIRNIMNNKISAVLALEGGEALLGNLDNIEHFYNKGVRIIAPVWNTQNELGYGQAAGDKGLKPFGIKCIEKMNELGIITDVSHINEAGFWDIDALCDTYMASHSNARAVTNHKRNLSDAQINAIIDKNGYIGLNLYPPFLGGGGYNELYTHVDYMLKKGAGGVLGIGADFDGIEITPVYAKNAGDMLKVSGKLAERYGEKTAREIMHNNLLLFLIRSL